MCVCVRVCVCLVWYMCMRVGKGGCSKGTAEKKRKKVNEQKKEIMCPLQGSNPQPCACETTVLSPVLLRMC